jgi:hypothetical protein
MLKRVFDSDGLKQPISKTDQDFIRFTAINDFIERKHVIQTYIQHHPSTPVSSLIVIMNYISVPMTIEVVVASSSQWERDCQKDEMEDFYKQAKENEGQFAIIQVLVRDGMADVDFADVKWKRMRTAAFQFLLLLPLSS